MEDLRQNEKKGIKRTIIDVLCTDRGGLNTKKILQKIKDKHMERIAFVILMIFIATLLEEQILRIFIDESIMEQAFYFNGGIAEVFAFVYIARVFLVGEKQGFKEFVKTHIWDILLTVFLIVAFFSALGGENRKYAFWGVMIRHDGYCSYLIYAAIYVCAKAVKSNKLRRWLIRAMGLLIFLLSITIFIQYNPELIEKMGDYGYNMCMYGTYTSIYYNINHFEYIMIMGIMAACVLVVIEENKLIKMLWLVVFGYDIWALIINDTFAGFVATVLGTVFMSIIMILINKKNVVPIVAVITVLIGMSIFTNIQNEGILSNNVQRSYSDAKTMDTNNAGGSGRVGLWKETIELIKKKPLLGYGPEGTYSMVINGETSNDRPHNEYLQHMLYVGIPAGIGYIVALITLFITMIKKLKYLPKEHIAMGVIVFAYCVSAFFGNSLYNTAPYFYMFLGSISVCGMIKKEDKDSVIKLEK